MQIKGTWERKRDVSLVNGIQDLIQKRGNPRLLTSLEGKTGENPRHFCLLQNFVKTWACIVLTPEFGQLSKKPAGNGEKHMSRHKQHQTVKATPQAPFHQMAVCQQGVRRSMSKRPQLNGLGLMPKQGHCLFELLLIIFLLI